MKKKSNTKLSNEHQRITLPCMPKAGEYKFHNERTEKVKQKNCIGRVVERPSLVTATVSINLLESCKAAGGYI